MLEDAEIEFYRQERDRLINILVDASFTSHLPSNPNAKVALNDFLIKVRMSSVKWVHLSLANVSKKS